MPNFRNPCSGVAQPIDELLALIARLTSPRRVRPVVTVSGQGVRGGYTSTKASIRSSYQSLLEEDFLRILEIAPSVSLVTTHPVVLALQDGLHAVTYTPDVLVQMDSVGALFEVKATFFLTRPRSRERIQRAVHLLRRQGVSLALVLDSDIRRSGLQTELKELLRLRPLAGRRRKGLDMCAWDPLNRAAPSEEMSRRWAAAQAECDALLKRVMRRDPDELFDAHSSR